MSCLLKTEKKIPKEIFLVLKREKPKIRHFSPYANQGYTWAYITDGGANLSFFGGLKQTKNIYLKGLDYGVSTKSPFMGCP